MAEVSALPACYSQSESIEETLKNVRDATADPIALYLDAAMDDERDIPRNPDIAFQLTVPITYGSN